MKVKFLGNNFKTFWGIAGSKISLCKENPGPIEININELTEQQKEVLKSSLKQGIIVETLENINKEKELETLALLMKKVSYIKKELKNKNIEELESLIIFEKQNKKRKGLLNLMTKILLKKDEEKQDFEIRESRNKNLGRYCNCLE